MNREIKLRAWDHIHKKMWYSNEFGESDGGYGFFMRFEKGNFESVLIRPHPADPHYSDVEKLRTMQWIGFKDRHGKEIYEGDIVLIEDGEHCQGISEFVDKGIVEFKQSAFVITGKYGCEPFCMQHSGEYSVIGNVFESPELLEGE